MKQIRRAGHVGNLHVAVLVLTVQFFGRRVFPRVFVAQLQVSLDSPGGMFRALSVITVRERNDKFCLRVTQMLKGGISVLVLLIVKNGMSLGKSPTLNILSTDTNMLPFH